MSQDVISLLHTLTQRTEEGSITEDSLLQLCEEQRNFHISICQCLEPYQPGASDAAYKWLFLWFSSNVTALRGYALQFIPPILSTYLSALYSPDSTSSTLKKRCEICLSALLNHLRDPPTPSVLSLGNATSYSSLYYYPGTPLDRHTTRESSSEGATPVRHTHSAKSVVEQRINGSTRPVILPLILAAFTDELSSVSTSVKLSFCRSVTIINASGLSDIPTSPYLTHCLDKQEHSQSLQLLHSLQERQRIRVSQALLIEMCQGLKFCLNGALLLATLQAAECLYFRSLLEGMHQAMLCSNALLNLLSEELSEEMREFELSSPTQVSTPVEGADDPTLEFERTEHVDSTVVEDTCKWKGRE